LVILVCVKLPYLPPDLCDSEKLEAIKLKLIKLISKVELGFGMFACAKMFIEVNLEEGLVEVIKLHINTLL
jgi:hypothetical protein